MFSNPIIRRYRFSQFRPQQLWIFGTLYTCILLLIFFINTSIYSVGEAFDSIRELYSALFIQLSVIQIVLIWLLMPMNCSNVVPREIANKSFDFFRMLPLPPSKKAIGILVGRNLFNILIAAFNLCLWLVIGFLGDISAKLLLQLLLLFVAGTLLLNSTSLLLSILSFKNKKRVSTPILVIIALLGFGPIVGMISGLVSEEKEVTAFLANFFNLEIPILYLVSAYVLIGAAWAFIGIRRRFSCEYEPLFSRKGALGFMACYIFLVYALYHKFMGDSEVMCLEYYFYSFYIVTLLPLAGIPLFSLRTFDKYIEITRLSKKNDRVRRKIFFNSNLFGGILLFTLWAIVTTVVGIRMNLLPDFWELTVLLFTSTLIVLSLIEIYAIYSPNNGKIGYLLAFIGGLYFVLPLILAGLFDNEYLTLFSPLGLLFSYETYNSLEELTPVLIINAIFLVPLLFLIRTRYSKIAKLRSCIDADG